MFARFGPGTDAPPAGGQAARLRHSRIFPAPVFPKRVGLKPRGDVMRTKLMVLLTMPLFAASALAQTTGTAGGTGATGGTGGAGGRGNRPPPTPEQIAAREA